MRATVVVVTYNHRPHIARCLDAVLPTLSAEDEVVVVDNSSRDGTADLVAAQYPTVQLIRSHWNRGFGAANNLAAHRSDARCLVFLNPDTEPQPGWLDALLAGLESAPGVGLATARLLLAADPSLVDTFGHTVHVSGIATCLGWGQPASRFERDQEVAAASGACCAIRRTDFIRLDGFDERLFLYYEDDDLSLRVRLTGRTCLAVANALVVHDHAAGFAPDKLRYLERNRWWTLLKVYRWRTLAALTPVLICGELIAWSMALRSGPRHVLAKLHAMLDVLSWLPNLPRARRRIERVIGDGDLLRLHATRLPFDQVARGPVARGAEAVAAVGFRGARALAGRLGAQ